MGRMFYAHADEIAASALGVGTSVAIAANTPIDPNNLLTLLTLLPGILGPALAVLAGRWSAAKGAKKRVRADYLEADAKAKLADDDPDNDAVARRERREAAELRAEADALERNND